MRVCAYVYGPACRDKRPVLVFSLISLFNILRDRIPYVCLEFMDSVRMSGQQTQDILMITSLRVNLNSVLVSIRQGSLE